MAGTTRSYHAVYDRHYMYNMNEYNVCTYTFYNVVKRPP